MHKTFDFKKYVEYKVYSVTTIKNGYGFRVLLTFADESTKTQQHAGFTTKREANAFRDEVIGQLHTGTYIVYGKIRVEEFMIFWLEDIMRPRITDDTYTTYKSAIKNYIVPQIGKMYMSTINQGYIRKLYNTVAEKYESVAKNVRTIMKTSLEYAFNIGMTDLRGRFIRGRDLQDCPSRTHLRTFCTFRTTISPFIRHLRLHQRRQLRRGP